MLNSKYFKPEYRACYLRFKELLNEDDDEFLWGIEFRKRGKKVKYEYVYGNKGVEKVCWLRDMMEDLELENFFKGEV